MEEIVEVEPLAPFERWYAEALASEEQPEAMTLATASRCEMNTSRTGADARPPARRMDSKAGDSGTLVRTYHPTTAMRLPITKGIRQPH